MHPILVGIDPGTTCAFAVLSFDFKVLRVKSKKEYPLAELIADIYKEGNPILVGTDKKEVPSFIKEFSQKTGAKIYSPKYDTKKGEKKHIVKVYNFSNDVKNAHETDALASAIFAYNEYSSLIKKIKNYTDKNSKQSLLDNIFIKVITEDLSISDAILVIEKKPKKKSIVVTKPETSFVKKELSKEEKKIFLLTNQVSSLKRDLKKLKDENNALKNKKIDIGKETKRIISFKENRALHLENENDKLRKEISAKDKVINRLDSFITKTKNYVLLKKLKNLGSEEYRKRNFLLHIQKDDILLIDDLDVNSESILNEIKDKVKIIIFERGHAEVFSSNFIMIEKRSLDLDEIKYFALAQKLQLDREIEIFLQTKKKTSDFIRNIVDDYKRQRFSDNIE